MGWLNGWNYRKSHIINQQAGAGTGYQIEIKVHYGSGTDSIKDVYFNGNCEPDFKDIRFTTSNGATLLDHWVERVDFGDVGVFWIEISEDLGAEDVSIYVYYGNSSVSYVSSGLNTFPVIHDDFGFRYDEDPNNPILSPAGGGAWDNSRRCVVSIVHFNGTYYMYYQGYNTAFETDAQIGLATSTDGVNFTPHPSNPIIPRVADTWEHWVANPAVVRVGSTWYMMYSGGDNAGNDMLIGLATSNDGITWTKNGGNPVFIDTASWISSGGYSKMEVAGLSYYDGTFYLYYFRKWGIYPRNVGIATSSDCVTWTPDGVNPVISNGDADLPAWMENGSASGFITPKVVKRGNIYYMILVVRASDTNLYLGVFSSTVPQFYEANRTVLTQQPLTSLKLDAPCFVVDGSSDNTQIYNDNWVIYYGYNVTPTYPSSTGIMVFYSWDDLTYNPSLDAIWEEAMSGGSYIIKEGSLQITGGVTNEIICTTSLKPTTPCVIMAKVQHPSTDSGDLAIHGDSTVKTDWQNIYVNEFLSDGITRYSVAGDDIDQTANLITFTIGSYAIFEIWRTGSKTYFYEGDSLLDTINYDISNNRYVGFCVRGTAKTLLCEWIVIRKFTDPEPAHGAWGNKESEATVALRKPSEVTIEEINKPTVVIEKFKAGM